jgi:hypothetical protein
MPHDELAARIEKLLGAKVAYFQPVAGGYTPAMRLRCHTATATFFAKIGVTPLTSKFLQREIRMYTQLRGPFLPQLVAWEEHEAEPILLIEDLSTGAWPPPWDERHLNLVLAQIDALHNTSAAIESFAEVPFLALGLVTPTWLEQALPLLLDSAGRCQTAGSRLAHWDLRSDNICITGQSAVFVDWNLACLANPALDLGFFLPSLAAEGGPLPEKILPDAPEIAAWVAGFFAARAGLPTIPDAPRVRWVQRQQLDTALPWAIRALDLPPALGRVAA